MAAQTWLTQRRLSDNYISNIVFMGQGEPLHNFENVKRSCSIFKSDYGLSIGSQKITISTSGYLPGIKKWIKDPIEVNFALSLHSTDMTKRNKLIPINKKFPLNEVLKHIDKIPLLKKQFITFEYLLIKDFNDSEREAQELGQLLKDRPAFINLIPFNPFPGSEYKRPEVQKMDHFKKTLDGFRIPTLIRITKGDEVLAACGQLNTALKKTINY